MAGLRGATLFWFIRRLIVSILLLWLVATVVFILIRVVPGDPVQILLSADGADADPAVVEALRRRLGLNQPLIVQYAQWLWSLLQLDFGVSLATGMPIIEDIKNRLPRTLELVSASAVISIVVGIPAGVAAALRRGGSFDRIASTLTAASQALPVFVIGTLMVVVFSQMLRLVPAGGYVEFSNDPSRHLLLLMMPAIALATGLGAIVFRITRSSVLEVTPQDYVRTANAKGIARRRINSHHILRNALMPVVTVTALQLGAMLSGTVLVEYVFNWPGLSGMLIRSVSSRDYLSVTAVLTVTSAIFIVINFVVDVIYGLLDPRVRQ